MQRIQSKWDEFLSVIDSSPDTELTIVVALVIPTLVWLGGAWVSSQVESAGPFTTLTDAVLARLDLVFVAIALTAYWRLGALAVSSYRRARQHLLRLH